MYKKYNVGNKMCNFCCTLQSVHHLLSVISVLAYKQLMFNKNTRSVKLLLGETNVHGQRPSGILQIQLSQLVLESLKFGGLMTGAHIAVIEPVFVAPDSFLG